MLSVVWSWFDLFILTCHLKHTLQVQESVLLPGQQLLFNISVCGTSGNSRVCFKIIPCVSYMLITMGFMYNKTTKDIETCREKESCYVS